MSRGGPACLSELGLRLLHHRVGMSQTAGAQTDATLFTDILVIKRQVVQLWHQLRVSLEQRVTFKLE